MQQATLRQSTITSNGMVFFRKVGQTNASIAYRSISLSALIMSREHSCCISGLRTHRVENKYLSISEEIRVEKSALLGSLLSLSCLLHTLARVDAVVTLAAMERMFSQAVNYATRKNRSSGDKLAQLVIVNSVSLVCTLEECTPLFSKML